MSLLLRGVRAFDPRSGRDLICDIVIDGETIAAVGAAPPDFEPQRVIEGGGMLAIPGVVDMGAHLREPGFEYKATILSEVKAAVGAGVTTLCCVPDTQPVADLPSTVELIQKRADEVDLCTVLVIGAMTKELRGEELSNMAALKKEGCVAFSNGLKPVANLLVMRRVMEYATDLGLPLLVHPLDGMLAKDGCAHEGPVATQLGLVGIPPAAETVVIGQCLALVEDIGARVHFCRLSCARSVELIAQARARGLPVTSDVAAHQLFLTEHDIGDFNPNCHVLPPFRSTADRDALRDGLRDGVIDAVCSDHQPHDISAKLAPFPASEPGISAVETLLPLMLKLADEEIISLARAIELITSAPAELLGLATGRLSEGAPADLCLLDPDETWTLSADGMRSSGGNTPFIGAQFKGRVRCTLHRGRIVHESGSWMFP